MNDRLIRALEFLESCNVSYIKKLEEAKSKYDSYNVGYWKGVVSENKSAIALLKSIVDE